MKKVDKKHILKNPTSNELLTIIINKYNNTFNNKYLKGTPLRKDLIRYRNKLLQHYSFLTKQVKKHQINKILYSCFNPDHVGKLLPVQSVFLVK